MNAIDRLGGTPTRFAGLLHPANDGMDTQEVLLLVSSEGLEFSSGGVSLGELALDEVQWRRLSESAWSFRIGTSEWFIFRPHAFHLFASDTRVLLRWDQESPIAESRKAARLGTSRTKRRESRPEQSHAFSRTSWAPQVEEVGSEGESPNDLRKDLELIRGIGPRFRSILTQLGYETLRDVAAITRDDEQSIQAAHPPLAARMERDGWVAQARDLKGWIDPDPRVTSDADIESGTSVRGSALVVNDEDIEIQSGYEAVALELRDLAISDQDPVFAKDEKEIPERMTPVGAGPMYVIELLTPLRPDGSGTVDSSDWIDLTTESLGQTPDPTPVLDTGTPVRSSPGPELGDELVKENGEPVRENLGAETRVQAGPPSSIAGSAGPLIVMPLGNTLKSPFGGLMRWYPTLLIVVLGGYALFDRGFAWLHIPGTPLFVGELTLLVGFPVLYYNSEILARAFRRSAPLVFLGLFLIWGSVLTIFGLPDWGIDAARDAAIWFYGLVALIVVAIIGSQPLVLTSWMRRYEALIPWLLVWLPLSMWFAAAFSGQAPMVPDSDVSLFSHKPSNIGVHAMIAIGFTWAVRIGVWSKWRTLWIATGGVLVVLASGTASRSGLLAAIVGLAILVLMRPRPGQLIFLGLGVASATLVFGFLADITVAVLPSARAVSSQQVIENLESVFNPNSSSGHLATTANWRVDLWDRVIQDVNAEAPLTGFGFGPSIGERYGVEWTAEGIPLRNPHNSHLSVLARMGWIGLGLWVLLWSSWFFEMLKASARFVGNGLATLAGLCAVMTATAGAILFNAIFDPTLEGPQVAFWLWTVFGIGTVIAISGLSPTPSQRSSR